MRRTFLIDFFCNVRNREFPFLSIAPSYHHSGSLPKAAGTVCIRLVHSDKSNISIDCPCVERR